jgi:hypothetical protein
MHMLELSTTGWTTGLRAYGKCHPAHLAKIAEIIDHELIARNVCTQKKWKSKSLKVLDDMCK